MRRWAWLRPSSSLGKSEDGTLLDRSRGPALFMGCDVDSNAPSRLHSHAVPRADPEAKGSYVAIHARRERPVTHVGIKHILAGYGRELPSLGFFVVTFFQALLDGAVSDQCSVEDEANAAKSEVTGHSILKGYVDQLLRQIRRDGDPSAALKMRHAIGRERDAWRKLAFGKRRDVIRGGRPWCRGPARSRTDRNSQAWKDLDPTHQPSYERNR